jgi:hypothetical protein
VDSSTTWNGARAGSCRTTCPAGHASRTT